ncbi:hypothetical protein QMA64_05155 [Leuconostoc suionicum]|uniref:hypothetical protein n=1 Tax=Leuconostoc suionicum TaxID=1511761 RepID=UPI0024AC89AF|nr:hypothetical protein [Leuconostoc suionicum]MDI6613969.1 hypothetical protein [Leuconostoc suionicum]
MSEEPVAYLNAYSDGSTSITIANISDLSKPLYFKEQLQQKVKMTRKQYNQFENYKIGKNNFYHFWQSLLCDEISLLDDVSEHDLMLAWINTTMIDIVPTKKWFVRSKKRDGNERFSYIRDVLTTQVVYGFSLSENLDLKEDNPYPFETEDEANLWTNPNTEAVQLPVEDE